MFFSSLVAESNPENKQSGLVNSLKKKAGKEIVFDKKEVARFNKKQSRCYKVPAKRALQRMRAKGGNERGYSSFKNSGTWEKGGGY
ncbi:hypothetical protein Tco_0349387 [Tanacetum coccineum]